MAVEKFLELNANGDADVPGLSATLGLKSKVSELLEPH